MRTRGFTLVELLITIGIVAILSSMLYSIGPSSRQFARDSRRKADLEQIRSALELYRNSNSTYPPCTVGTGCTINTTNVPALTSSYISEIPTDPSGTSRLYGYRPFDSAGGACDGTATDRCVTYSICSALEKVTTVVSGSPACAVSGCGSTCSYRVQSP